MHFGQASVRNVRFANGDPVDSCDKFEYLGVPTSNAETVFRSRLSKAWAAATKLRSIFNSKANDSIKIGLCRSAVESILLYGLECLPLTLTLQDKLDSAYRRILRYALGVHFPDCIFNAELTRRTGATALSKALRQRRLRFVVHALRMANPSPIAILLRFLQPGFRRRRGQARTLTLHQNIIDDISAINQSVKSITSASKSYFNRIVATLTTKRAFNIYCICDLLSFVSHIWHNAAHPFIGKMPSYILIPYTAFYCGSNLTFVLMRLVSDCSMLRCMES